MVLDTVITIVNYDRHMFIVQATGIKLSQGPKWLGLSLSVEK